MGSLCAEVVSIGDEMTSGARLDTNAPWISTQLGELGIRVLQHTTVGDNLDADVAALWAAALRADVVVVTGGLGPTADDLTRQALAMLAGVPLELDRDSLRHIEALFASRGRVMPERNAVQAMFPRGTRVIANPHGTAPGIDLQIARPQGGHARVLALPGVPAEMKQMWWETVRPRLIEQLGGGRRVLQQAVVKCFGVGESEMEQLLGEMIVRGRSPEVGITVSQATISLRILAEGGDPHQCQAMIQAVRREIDARAGQFVFGEGEQYELQHAVADRLAARGESLATVETGAGNLVGHWLAELERPELFRGAVAWTDPQEAASRLAALLRLPADDRSMPETSPSAGPAPQTRAALRPDAVRRFFGCDWLLLVEGYPQLSGPDGSAAQRHPVRIAAVAADGRQHVHETEIGGHPEIIKPRIAKAALYFLWQVLGRD